MVATWRSGGIELPQEIEDALQADKLVLFCGAGISAARPACLPGFRNLVKEIADDLGRPELLPADPRQPIKFDEVMGELNEIRHDVHARVSTRLRATTEPNQYHRDLIRVVSAAGREPRIITTNFDLLFETAAEQAGLTLATHVAPALPLGNHFSGLVHLHGPIDPNPEQRMVLTDRDFGQAYITEGWATQFLTRVFEEYVTLFIGYSADDTVLRYLTRALPAAGKTRFAFMSAADGETAALRWTRLDVTPIRYPIVGDDKHAALEAFLTSWRKRVTASAAERFDAIASIVGAGPDHLPIPDEELRWMMGEREYAQHFLSLADPVMWLPKIAEIGVLDDLFEPSLEAPDAHYPWAEWMARSIVGDSGAALVSILAKREGKLGPALWFQIWGRLFDGYQPDESCRRLLLVLAADQPSRDIHRLSSLIKPVADRDIPAAEVLLHHLLVPRLRFNSYRGILGNTNSLASEMSLAWKPSWIRDAWPTMLPGLSDPDYLLSTVLGLIRGVETTTSLFDGHDHRVVLSARRYQIDGVEPYGRDEPYVFVIDIARDLLREFARTGDTDRALQLLGSPSELVRRLAIDALVEARIGDADHALQGIISRGLLFGRSYRPEIFRLLTTKYRHASAPVRTALLDYIQQAEAHPDGRDIENRERYDLITSLLQDLSPDDPAHEVFDLLQTNHPDFVPRDFTEFDGRSFRFSPDEIPTEPDGRFRATTVQETVAQLCEDASLDDVFEHGPVIRELKDFLEQRRGEELQILDEFLRQTLHSPAAWATVLQQQVSPGNTWTAETLMCRIEQLPNSQLNEVAQSIVYNILRPTDKPDNQLDNALERCRLLLNLWRHVTVEPLEEDDGPKDPSAAHSTQRGALAYAFVQASLQSTQERELDSVEEEFLAGYTELICAQDQNPHDPSGMMLSRYSGHLLALAEQWFDVNLQPRLNKIEATPQSLSLWVGVLTSHHFSLALMQRTRAAVRTGWQQVSTSLPGSVENFIQIHSAQFAFYTAPDELTWADPFIAVAPTATRVRWIRSVARHLERDNGASEALLFGYWQHRLEGQPPLEGAEQRALLDWVMIPNIDLDRAVDLFTKGPEASIVDGDEGFDYYDLDDFPQGKHQAFLRVGLHLLQGRSTLPSFTKLFIDTAQAAKDEHLELVQQVWSELLRLGYGPARDHLELDQ